MMLLAVVAMNFTACETEDAVIPTITAEPLATNDYSPGSTVAYTIAVATVNKELKTFAVGVAGTTITDGVFTQTGEVIKSTGDFYADLTQGAFTFSFTLDANAVAGTEVALTFTVEDDETTNDAVKTFTVGAATTPIVEFTDVVSTGSYSSSTTLNGFDAATGNAVAPNTSETFVVIYNGTYGNSIVSPDATWLGQLYSWNTVGYSGGESTKLQRLTNVDYTTIDAEYIQDMTVTGEEVYNGSGYSVDMLEVGDLIAFETIDNNKGVIKINSITWANPNKVDVPINYSVKVQTSTSAGK